MYGGTQVARGNSRHSSFNTHKKSGSLSQVYSGFQQSSEFNNRDEKYDPRYSSLKRNGSLLARQNQSSFFNPMGNNYDIDNYSDNGRPSSNMDYGRPSSTIDYNHPPSTMDYGRPSSRQSSSASHQSSVSRNNSISQKRSSSRQSNAVHSGEYSQPYFENNPINASSSSQQMLSNTSEAIVEEERNNADGSTVLVRRKITTVVSDNDASKIEFHISPAAETIFLPPTASRNNSFDYVKMSSDEGSTNQLLYRDNFNNDKDDRSYIKEDRNYDQDNRSDRDDRNYNRDNRNYDRDNRNYDRDDKNYDRSNRNLYGSAARVNDKFYSKELNNQVNENQSNNDIRQNSQNYFEKSDAVKNQARYSNAENYSSNYAANEEYSSLKKQSIVHDSEIRRFSSNNESLSQNLYSDNRNYLSNTNINIINSNYVNNANNYGSYANNIGFGNNSSNILSNSASNSNINANKVNSSNQQIFNHIASSNQQIFNNKENTHNSDLTINNQFSQSNRDFSQIENSARINSHETKYNEESINLLDLLNFLKTNDHGLKSQAAGYLMHLSYKDEEIKKRICELDIIPMLVKLLADDDEDCYRNAAGALKNLSYGRFLDDNKLAIQSCGGVVACSKLLYKTSSIDVREHITGILYNISSVKSISIEILKECLEVVSMLVIIPLSGWEREYATIGKKPRNVIWSVLLRNSTGVLRNVSSAGRSARVKIRLIDGLIDSLIWILRAAIEQNKQDPESDIISNKIVENIMCVLRNLSYNIDKEVDRLRYLDALKISVKDGENFSNNTLSHDATLPYDATLPRDAILDNTQLLDKKEPSVSSKGNTSEKGFLGMKKKPFGGKIQGKISDLARDENPKPPREKWNYLIPVQENQPVTNGVQLLWQQETVTYYILILKSSINPVTLEAAAAAIHNLCAGEWNWSALLRIHVRLQKGLPPIGDLLTVDQEYVVRAVAHALRNLAIDSRNKWSIGKFIHRNLLSVLPPITALQRDVKPSEYTICAILSTLQILVCNDQTNSRFIKNEGGIEKLVALTKEPVVGIMPQECLRVYSKKVILEANRVLLYMWDFKDCRELIKQQPWSHSKAEEAEENYKNLANDMDDKDRDVYAEMESQDSVKLESDPRRYLISVDNNFSSLENESLYNGSQNSNKQPIGYGDVPFNEVGTQKPLLHSKISSKKWYKRAAKNKKK
ncbi:uncharacterized protein LOC136071883 isoform X2 [Hydra vulgaris]|uniref:Uncharacterized protein LOC136071883 isoform X2 n=1 Tax=Hydra vulgaris TaxID=6087 RepID=A0ABM4BWK1_HYDVU